MNQANKKVNVVIKPFSQTDTNHNEKIDRTLLQKYIIIYIYMGALNGDSHIRGNLKGNDRGQGREEPAGPPGQKGNKGDTGAQGPKGDTGVQEQKGDTGG